MSAADPIPLWDFASGVSCPLVRALVGALKVRVSGKPGDS